MAFNFNWSPLTADADFYKRARDLLTAALNKSPKPPIIVDDILVTEFNLGSVPPDLEILEIGDLAEDRFRGIFKMCYSGDAFLTLRTRVQVGDDFLACSCFRYWVFAPLAPFAPMASEVRKKLQHHRTWNLRQYFTKIAAYDLGGRYQCIAPFYCAGVERDLVLQALSIHHTSTNLIAA